MQKLPLIAQQRAQEVEVACAESYEAFPRQRGQEVKFEGQMVVCYVRVFARTEPLACIEAANLQRGGVEERPIA